MSLIRLRFIFTVILILATPLLFINSFVTYSYAQIDIGSWHIYNTSNSDLPSNNIRDITFDNDDSVWISTVFGGVARFDGSNWTIYNTSNSPLPNNIVSTVVIDQDGSRWFGTDGYVARYDELTWVLYNQFNSTLHDNEIISITIDPNGSKWFSTWGGGAAHFDGTNWTYYDPINSGLPSIYVSDIEIDLDSTQWFSTVNGVASFDGSSWNTYNTANSGLPHNFVRVISITPDGTKWFSTHGGGIAYFDGVTWGVYNTTNSGLPDNVVYDFIQDSNGSKWFATNGGLAKYDGATWKTYNTSNSCLPHNAIKTIEIGPEGAIWIGTEGGGVAVLLDENGSDCNAPISTPTPIPTPSPTPIPTTKVVIVPGMGASWNAEALLTCKADNYSGDWTLIDRADPIYLPLLNDINENGYDPYLYAYDWRKRIPTSGTQLGEYIDGLTANGERVHLVGHSMGGLVGRAYLEQTGDDNQLDRFLTVGSPHRGVPSAYPAWSGGEIWANGFLFRIYLKAAQRICMQIHSLTPWEAIHTYIPSVQDLLPVFDYLWVRRTGTFTPVSDMVVQNQWLPTSDFSHPFHGVTVGTLSGKDHRTLQSINVSIYSWLRRLGIWLDGFPNGRNFTDDGDGTVLLSSSQVVEADNIDPISQKHTDLMSSEEGRNKILDFLGIPSLTSQIEAEALQPEPETVLFIAGYPTDFTVTDTGGKTMKDRDGLLIIENPKSGNYKLKILPRDSNAQIVVAQFHTNDRMFLKTYDLRSRKTRLGSIQFDTRRPREDALRWVE